jgi:hypothetical protein
MPSSEGMSKKTQNVTKTAVQLQLAMVNPSRRGCAAKARLLLASPSLAVRRLPGPSPTSRES